MFDAMHGSGDSPRLPCRSYGQWFEAEDPARLRQKSAEAEHLFRRTGITFNVYGDNEALRALPDFEF